MKTSLEMVKEFNDSFEIEYPNKPMVKEELEDLKHSRDFNFCVATLETCGQTLNILAAVHKSSSLLRIHLLTEEIAELSRAVLDRDIVEIYDALVDIQYVLDGTFLHFGLHDLKQKGLEEVHASNMSKLGKDGRPFKSPSGRVKKSPEYVAPDLAKFLKNE